MKLEPKAAIQIQKPAAIVYEAIVNPKLMSKYFISKGSSRLDSSHKVYWSFPEFEAEFPVTEINCIKNKSISFVWDPETVVKICLENAPNNSTVIRVVESGKEFKEENIGWAIENSGGWANFLACMKAFLEYDIPLRKGAFDFMKQSK